MNHYDHVCWLQPLHSGLLGTHISMHSILFPPLLSQLSSEPVHPLSSSPHLQHPWWSISSLTSSWTGITSRPHGNRTCQTFGKPKSIPASTIWGQLSQPISGNNRIWLSLGLPHYIPKVHSKFRPVLTCAFGTVFSPSPMRKNENNAF